jgi:hypothetical protein
MNMKHRPFTILILVALVALAIDPARAQGTETLLASDTRWDSMWSLELKTNSLRNTIGSLIGIYWGGVLNRSLIFGIGGVANLTHTLTNYGSLQLLVQYMPEPDKLIHVGGHVIFGFASVKDYQTPKNGLLDNFANTSGAGYYFVEPRLNAEMNITRSEKIVLGVSYCHAFGLDEQSRHVAQSKVTNKDLSGINVTIGVKFGEY